MVTAIDLASLQQLRATFAGLAGAGTTGSDSSSSSAGFDSLIAAMTSANPSTDTLGNASVSTGGGFSLSALLSGSSAVSATTSSTSGSGGVTGADVVADAEKYIGVPYVLGGESTSGMDCSGLVQKTFADLGVSTTRLVHTQKLEGQPVDGLANAKPGDLIVFKGGGHIGIYAGNDMVIHAPYPGRTVSLQKLWVGDSGIETIRRIVPSGDSTTSTADSSSASTASSTATDRADSSTPATDASASSTPDTLSQYIAAQEAQLTQGAA